MISMKKILVIAVFLILANTSFAMAQSESTKVPGSLSSQTTVDPGVGESETKYVEADGYMKQKKPFWSDDSMMIGAGLAVLLIGGLFFAMKKRNAASKN
jgi:LPXTG-motif cell wall-anchored protein